MCSGRVVLVDGREDVELIGRNDLYKTGRHAPDIVDRSHVQRVGHGDGYCPVIGRDRKKLVLPGELFGDGVDNRGIDGVSAQVDILDSGSFGENFRESFVGDQVHPAHDVAEAF